MPIMTFDGDRFNRRPGATPMLIDKCERQLGLKLPPDYAEFLMLTNGGEGFIGSSSYAMFCGVDELASTNEAYQISTYMPGCLLFGSDGGGEAYGFDTHCMQFPVVSLPFVGMDWSLSLVLAESFSSFIKRLSEVQ